MSISESLQSSLGAWQGTSRLWLPDEPTRESASHATVASAIGGRFCQITYAWLYDNAPQAGLLLFAVAESQAVNGIFADSWHMGDAIMACQGDVASTGAISMLGSYAVEGSPDWGWRIVIEPADDSLRIAMYNVAPDGQEMLGFETRYSQ